MSLFLDDGDVRLYHGDALEVLKTLPDESVHCCVTSPPFFGLRDYQTGRWEGGNPDCDHAERRARKDSDRLDGGLAGGHGGGTTVNTSIQYRVTCGKCGARRVDQQIGLEDTPEAWVASLVAVFREVKRVLRPEGTLWLEIGDSYAQQGGKRIEDQSGEHDARRQERYEDDDRYEHARGLAAWRDRGGRAAQTAGSGLKPKDLIGAPWQLAFALRADGWYLRSDIVWARPNPMPESVTDRPTKSHSYIFLLAKQPRYFFDQEAVREPHNPAHLGRYAYEFWSEGTKEANGAGRPGGPANTGGAKEPNPAGRNVRSVWNIATQPYPEAHFATFPEELARRCILAGTSERGCCPECGIAWTRELSETAEYREWKEREKGGWAKRSGDLEHGRGTAGSGTNSATVPPKVETLGWKLDCMCDNYGHTPCVVLDPFVGSGTVPYVARKHGRHAIGIDLSQSYLELASRRLQQLSLFA